jgi:hypothetical protein
VEKPDEPGTLVGARTGSQTTPEGRFPNSSSHLDLAHVPLLGCHDREPGTRPHQTRHEHTGERLAKSAEARKGEGPESTLA